MFYTIELFAGAGGLALGVEKAGFESLGLIEYDKDAADTLKKNRPNWNTINDDIANISCLDLEKYFHLKKGELELLSGGHLVRHFRMQVKGWDWKMPEERFFITMRYFYRSCSQRCSCLKTLEDCLRMIMEIHIKLC